MKVKKLTVAILIAITCMCGIFTLTSCNKSSDANHVLIEVPAVDATCVSDGNRSYYKCSHCDKLFLDASAQDETTI